MPICGYLVLTEPGAAPEVAERIAALPGCDVVPAAGHDLLLLVTEAPDRAADDALRARLESTAGVSALCLTFGAPAGEARA